MFRIQCPKGYSFLLLLLSAISLNSWAILPAADANGRELPSLAPLLKQVNPAVVNIGPYSSCRPPGVCIGKEEGHLLIGKVVF